MAGWTDGQTEDRDADKDTHTLTHTHKHTHIHTNTHTHQFKDVKTYIDGQTDNRRAETVRRSDELTDRQIERVE